MPVKQIDGIRGTIISEYHGPAEDKILAQRQRSRKCERANSELEATNDQAVQAEVAKDGLRD